MTFNPTMLERGLKADFLMQVAGLDRSNLVPRIATVIDSDGPDEKLGWIGQAPAMQDISDKPLTFEALSDASYTIPNSTYAGAISVRRADVEDDRLGGLHARIGQLAATAVGHRNKLLIDLLVDNGLGYDATAFFSATHPVRNKESAAQNNIATGTGTTTAQVASDLNLALSQMALIEAENGEPFHEMLSNLIVIAPPALMKPMNEALKAGIISNTSNVQFDGMSIEPIFSARLSDANDWYLLNVGGGVKPLVFLDRVALEFTGLEGDSDEGFKAENYLYKVRGRYGAGYGLWQNAQKVTNT